MAPEKEKIYEITELLDEAVRLLDTGVMAVECDSDLNCLSNPVVVDNLAINHLASTEEGISFWLCWRPIGITEKFESGSFNVEEPKYIKVNEYNVAEDRITFSYMDRENVSKKLCLIPITDEYMAEWEEWNRFKLENRDLFEELDLEMANILHEIK